jgi:hypothetical protein
MTTPDSPLWVYPLIFEKFTKSPAAQTCKRCGARIPPHTLHFTAEADTGKEFRTRFRLCQDCRHETFTLGET